MTAFLQSIQGRVSNYFMYMITSSFFDIFLFIMYGILFYCMNFEMEISMSFLKDF